MNTSGAGVVLKPVAGLMACALKWLTIKYYISHEALVHIQYRTPVEMDWNVVCVMQRLVPCDCTFFGRTHSKVKIQYQGFIARFERSHREMLYIYFEKTYHVV